MIINGKIFSTKKEDVGGEEKIVNIFYEYLKLQRKQRLFVNH